MSYITQLASFQKKKNSISTSPIDKRMKSKAVGLSVYLTNRKKKIYIYIYIKSTSPNTADTTSSYKF